MLTKDQIKEKLCIGPPGIEAQYQMAASHRPGPEFAENPPNDVKIAAVLLLLYYHNDRLTIPMMQRPPNTGPHSLQISFPGGRFELNDRDYWQTALREAKEEFGINPREVTQLGELSSIYIEPSNYLVYPFVGWMEKVPNFTIAPQEVWKLIEFSVLDFCDKNKTKEYRNIRGMQVNLPMYKISGQEIWGASAMIMSEFMAIF